MSTISSSVATGGESFADLFAESIKNQDMKPGEVISAEVVRIDHNFVVVNAGLKSEALIPLEEFLNDQGELEVEPGDFVSVAIDSLENGYGDTILSRSAEHTSDLQSLMRNSYAVFCLDKKISLTTS